MTKREKQLICAQILGEPGRVNVIVGMSELLWQFDKVGDIYVTRNIEAGYHWTEHDNLLRGLFKEKSPQIVTTQSKEILECLASIVKDGKFDLRVFRVCQYKEETGLVDYTTEQFSRAMKNRSEIRGY